MEEIKEARAEAFVMVGNLVAKVAARCRAEPADLYAAMRSAGGRI
jgi:hypothetical protein